MTYRRATLLLPLLCLLAFRPQASAATERPLTLDSTLQSLAERLLTGERGAIVAIEPATGEVKCLASAPVPDTVNRAIGHAYSPGSTFKVAQALALLSEGIITPHTSYPCSKGFYHAGIHIGCHPHRSPLALTAALGNSCNSYFCRAFMALVRNRHKYHSKLQSIDTWHALMQSLGLGRRLGIDMEGEASGLIPSAAYLQQAHHGRWNEATIMWVGMGQGEVSLTPLQLANLAAVVANRGWYITPHIHRYDSTDALYSRYHQRHQSLIRPTAFAPVWAGMHGAMTYGTARELDTEEFSVCGKTGTAENSGDDHSIFIGFAPATAPRLAIAVYIEHGGFGADLAAPVALQLLTQYVTGKSPDQIF